MSFCKFGIIVSLAALRITFKSLYLSCIAPDSWTEDQACTPIAALTILNILLYVTELFIYLANFPLVMRLFCAPPPPPKPKPAQV